MRRKKLKYMARPRQLIGAGGCEASHAKGQNSLKLCRNYIVELQASDVIHSLGKGRLIRDYWGLLGPPIGVPRLLWAPLEHWTVMPQMRKTQL